MKTLQRTGLKIYINTKKMKKLLQIEKTSWLHMVNPSHSEIDDIVEKYDLHEIIEEDLKEKNTQDKIDVYDDSFFLILHFPKYHTHSHKHYENELNFIIRKDFIFSFSKHPTNTIETIKEEYLKEFSEEEIDKELKSSPYYILYQVLDWLYDKTISWLKKFSSELLNVENEIFERWDNINKNLLWTLLKKSRNISFLKNLFLPHEEILWELNKATIKLHWWDLEVYFEDLQYKVDRIMNTIERLSENTESISSKYNTLVTLKTNSVVWMLTTVTVLVGLMTLITGFYGMNVQLPWQDTWSMRIVISSTMILVAVFMLLLFKKKNRM